MLKLWRQLLLHLVLFNITAYAGPSAASSGGGGQSVKFYVYGLQNQATFTKGATIYDPVPTSGGGIGFERGGPSRGWRLDVMSITRGYKQDDSSSRIPYLLVPITYVFHVFKYVDFGIGGYYGQAQGNSFSTPTGMKTYEESFFDKTDAGFTTRLGLTIPIRSWQLIFQAQYNQGIYDISNTEDFVIKFNDKIFSFGLKFGGGGAKH